VELPDPGPGSFPFDAGQPLQPFPEDSQPLAPALADDFTGLTDTGFVIPPDTMGAAGPSHLVSTLNGGWGIFNKSTGAILDSDTLKGFWSPLIIANGLPDDAFDPKVLYDQFSGRFIIVSLSGRLSPDSWIMLAVSTTSDPTDPWNLWAINADVVNRWADYPGLGIDSTYVYITANMFPDAGVNPPYSKVWMIPKPQLLAGTNPITWTEFVNPTGSGFTMQPAHVFGDSSTEDLVHEGFYIAGSPPRRFLRISRITPGGPPTWTDLGYIEVSSYPLGSLPNAPQSGSANLIETNDTRILNAVFRNGTLWATHHVADSTDPRTEVAWYQIDPAEASPSFPGVPIQQGRIADPARSYYFPSIAVNARGDAGVGFSGSSPTEYAGAYYTARLATDPPGTMQQVAPLKTGEAPYFKDFGSGSNRWGDYSATCVDPSDDLTFWTLQEYAAAVPANTWGTWWGSFSISPPPATGVTFTPPPSPASPQPAGTSVTFTAAGEEGSGTYEYKFYRRDPSGTWTLEQDYPPGGSGSATWVWDTAGAALGTHTIQVWARSAGSTAPWEAVQGTSYTIGGPAPDPVTEVTFTPAPSPASPSPAGDNVTFTALATGGVTPQYKFYLRDPSGTWTLEQDYPANSDTWLWLNTGAAEGTYTIQVWARSTGSAAAWEAVQGTSYTIGGPAPDPVTGVTFTPAPSPASPSPAGDNVTFTALATGGVTPQYKFWLRDPSGAWTLEQDYPANSNTWLWLNTGVAPGTYTVQVWARSTGSEAAWEAVRSTSYEISP
jgi:hypothetical protein